MISATCDANELKMLAWAVHLMILLIFLSLTHSIFCYLPVYLNARLSQLPARWPPSNNISSAVPPPISIITAFQQGIPPSTEAAILRLSQSSPNSQGSSMGGPPSPEMSPSIRYFTICLLTDIQQKLETLTTSLAQLQAQAATKDHLNTVVTGQQLEDACRQMEHNL